MKRKSTTTPGRYAEKIANSNDKRGITKQKALRRKQVTTNSKRRNVNNTAGGHGQHSPGCSHYADRGVGLILLTALGLMLLRRT